jgi:hypothetical protein
LAAIHSGQPFGTIQKIHCMHAVNANQQHVADILFPRKTLVVLPLRASG